MTTAPISSLLVAVWRSCPSPPAATSSAITAKSAATARTATTASSRSARSITVARTSPTSSTTAKSGDDDQCRIDEGHCDNDSWVTDEMQRR